MCIFVHFHILFVCSLFLIIHVRLENVFNLFVFLCLRLPSCSQCVFLFIANFGCQFSLTLETVNNIITKIVLFEVMLMPGFSFVTNCEVCSMVLHVADLFIRSNIKMEVCLLFALFLYLK